MNIDNVLKSHGIGIGGSNIKSMQSGQIIFNDNEVNKIVNISSVNLKCSIPIISIVANKESAEAAMLVTVKFISNTELFLRKNEVGTNITVNWKVVEFNNVKSLQKGEIQIQSQSNGNINTSNISNINQNKSIVVYSFRNYVRSSGFYPTTTGVWISSENELSFLIQSPSAVDISWFLIEFK